MAKRKIFGVSLFQCDGFMALEHKTDEKMQETKCNLRPNQKQWDSGLISVEHDIKSLQYQCQTCFAK